MEIRLFATLRENRDKIYNISDENIKTGFHILKYLNIDEKDAAIYLINGLHSNLSDEVSNDDVISIFPPVGGG